MNPKHRGRRKKEGFHLDPHILGPALDGDPVSVATLTQIGLALTGTYARTISIDDRRDIVAAALAEACQVAATGGALPAADKAFRRALNRDAKRVQREQHRRVESPPSSTATVANHVEEYIEFDHFRVVVLHVMEHLLPSLEALTDRQHDLLVRYSHLDEVGIEPRLPAGAFVYANPDSYDHAVRYAALKFSEALEARLMHVHGDPMVLADALRIVRGGVRVVITAIRRAAPE